MTPAEADRELLESMTPKGEHPARKLARARTLLVADGHGRPDEDIRRSTGTSVWTVYRTKARFVEGVEHALSVVARAS